MAGASPQSRRVKVLNANWTPNDTGGDGRFELMIITDDDENYVVPAGPAAVTALVEIARADAVLAWDPTNRSLIAANIVGTMPWTVSENA